MINNLAQYLRSSFLTTRPIEKEAAEAYDIWGETYDHQPDNLMLVLDEQLVARLLGSISFENKAIADVGCGTGRHWDLLQSKKPARLTGYDVSAGMLKQLRHKYPDADAHLVTDNLFSNVPPNTFDLIICTLTIAHIADVNEAINAWSRVLKPEGEVVLTDFHPASLQQGGKRTFKHHGKSMAVTNFVHTLPRLVNEFEAQGFKQVCLIERRVDETVKHYYEKQDSLAVYRKFEGMPIIYGMHLKR